MAQNSRKEKPKSNKDQIRKDITIEGLNKVDKPVQWSIATAIIWFVISLALAGILEAVNGDGYDSNLMTTSIVNIGVAVMWGLFRFGLLEKSRKNFRNYRNKRLVKDFNVQKDLEMSKDDYREFLHKQSWVGVGLLLTLSAVVTLITALVFYL